MELLSVTVIGIKHVVDDLVEHGVGHDGDVVWSLVEIKLMVNCWVAMVKAVFVYWMLARS